MRFCAQTPSLPTVLACLALAGGPAALFCQETAEYSGTVHVRQIFAGEEVKEGAYTARALSRTVGEAGAPPSVLELTRILRPTQGEEPPIVGIDRYTLERAGPGAFALKPAGEAAPELEENARSLQNFLPGVFLPTFAAVPGEAGARGEAELLVFDGATLRSPVVLEARKEGAGVLLERRLSAGERVAATFRGDRIELVEWRDALVLEPGKTHPARVDQSYAVEMKIGDQVMRLERRIALERTLLIPSGSAEATRLDALAREAAALDRGFLELSPPESLKAELERFTSAARGTPLALAAEAFEQRLKSYQGLGLGRQAPDFTLESLDGKMVSFRDFTAGKVVLLSFWGVDCPPCRKEAPHLTRLQEKYAARGFTVVAANGYDEERSEVEAFARKEGLGHPILLKAGKVGETLYGVEGFPTLFWINARGRIVGRETGFSEELVPGIERRLESLLREARSAAK